MEGNGIVSVSIDVAAAPAPSAAPVPVAPVPHASVPQESVPEVGAPQAAPPFLASTGAPFDFLVASAAGLVLLGTVILTAARTRLESHRA